MVSRAGGGGRLPRLILAGSLAAAPGLSDRALSSEDPLTRGGYAPNTVVDGDALGEVNPLNGALNLVHPFGGSFRVNEALSYGLVRSYSSSRRAWMTEECPEPCTRDQTAINLHPLGWGWTLHFGRIHHDQEGSVYYQEPNGSSHELFGAANPAVDCPAGTPSGLCWITRDGSFIRAVKTVSGSEATWRVWTPDGVLRILDVKEFFPPVNPSPNFLVSRIVDPMGETDPARQEVQITYFAHSHGSTTYNLLDAVTDTVRGSSTVTIDFEGHIEGSHPLIDKVHVLQADGSMAHYTLSYAMVTTPANDCASNVYLEGPPDVPLLESVSLELGVSSTMVWDYDYAQDGAPAGFLTGVKLPAGLGQARYDNLRCVVAEREVCDKAFSTVKAIGRKRVAASTPNATCDSGTDCWRYARCEGDPLAPSDAECLMLGLALPTSCPATPPQTNCFTNPKRAYIIDPLDHKRAFFYEWGCKLQQSIRNGAARRIQTFGPNVGGNRTLKRTQDIEYAPDSTGYNYMAATETTTFNDHGGTFVKTTREGRDDYGHFATERQTTNEGRSPITIARCSITDFAPDPSAWILGKFTRKRVTPATATACNSTSPIADADYRFDAQGRMRGERRYKTPNTPTGDDVVTYLGWTGWERLCKEQCLTASCSPFWQDGTDISCASLPGCIQSARYVSTRTIQNGAVASEGFEGVPFESLNQINGPNGAAVEAFDAMTAFSRRLTHDKAGRVTTVQFRRNGANGDEQALDIGWTDAAAVSWTRGTLASGKVRYDHLGRRRQTRVASPNDPGMDFVKTDEHDAVGNVVRAGDWCESSASEPGCEDAEIVSIDPFGRPGKVQRGGVDQVEYSYAGLETTRTTHVKTGTGESDVVTVLTRDGFDRLIKVTEPSAAGSGDRVTTYTYDELDRLRTVTITPFAGLPQSRTFVYGGLSLVSSTEPESGTTTFTKYDPLGQLREFKDEDDVETVRSFDCAGRLLVDDSTKGGGVGLALTTHAAALGRKATALPGSVTSRR